ncbi:proteasome ATPase [Schaalia sp. ZJ405]|uniref:proteasome ATPase n=1 Tax=Schaalia sp. ZJ405 TaxID=2709403 RepID=UPI0013ED2FCA|nr:proteasome ATPase [Schaalia sp. ZJ405]QPK82071.1 proteasome ATPase [Schaalia sp. ZJ405]
MSENFHETQIDEMQRIIAGLEQKNERLSQALTQVRGQLVKMQAQLQEVNRPPLSLATFVRADLSARQVEAIVNGRRMRLAMAPNLNVDALSVGQLIRVDDKMVAVAPDGFERTGSLASIREVLGDDRVLVTAEGGAERVVELAGPLRHGNLRPGDSLVIDIRAGLALERIVRSDVEQLLTPEIPQTTYEDIGGLDRQIQQVRDAVELPLRHPEMYRAYGLRPPKGILLYGPPGSGKTLIAKAVANSLSRRGGGSHSYFLSIKGPELLNKFVGETERQIRAIFARARSLAAGDVPVVIFFDEMEALFRTRGTGVSSDVETMIVPQLLAEMDGVESLDNVVIIGASNRADMIDPAVLRPGRLDVRIRVERPDRVGARDIFSKYLTTDIPIAEDEVRQAGSVEQAIDRMKDRAVDVLYREDASTALFDVTVRSGGITRVYVHDIISGAMIAGTVERAKKHAIKAALDGTRRGLSMSDLLTGVEEEMRESIDMAATTSADEWARTIGLSEDVTAIRMLRGDE